MIDSLSIFKAAAAYDNAIALYHGLRKYTYIELAQLVEKSMHSLKKLPEQEPVIIQAVPGSSTIVNILACLESGRCFVPVSAKLKKTEKQKLFLACGASNVLCEKGRLESTGFAGKSLISSKKPAAIVFTSGSTGNPKGVVFSKDAFFLSAKAGAKHLGLTFADRWILSMPLFHVAGLGLLCRCFLTGASVDLHEKFLVDEVFSSIKKGATFLSVVPTMTDTLIKHDSNNLINRLKVILQGGAKTPSRLLLIMAQKKLPVYLTYGMTETCSQVATMKSPLDTGLTPLKGVKIKFSKKRILVSCPWMMEGYLKASAEYNYIDDALINFKSEYFFETGDMGYEDSSGKLHITGRADGIIITGGENVDPAEVENALLSIDGISQCCVFALKDEKWGMRVAAAVCSEKKMSYTNLKKSLAEKLSFYKIPKEIFFYPDFPMLENGKIDIQRIIEDSTKQ